MTSSVAGHGALTEEALQDFDLLMDETTRKEEDNWQHQQECQGPGV